jgi:hypothetical protein
MAAYSIGEYVPFKWLWLSAFGNGLNNVSLVTFRQFLRAEPSVYVLLILATLPVRHASGSLPWYADHGWRTYLRMAS